MEEHSFFLGSGYIVGSDQDPRSRDHEDSIQEQDEQITIIPSELCSCGKANWSKLHDSMTIFNSTSSSTMDIERLLNTGHSIVRVYNAPVLKKPTRQGPAGEIPQSLKQKINKNYFKLSHIEWNDVYHGIHNYRSTQVIPIRLVGYDIMMYSTLIQNCYAFCVDTKLINVCRDLCIGVYSFS